MQDISRSDKEYGPESINVSSPKNVSYKKHESPAGTSKESRPPVEPLESRWERNETEESVQRPMFDVRPAHVERGRYQDVERNEETDEERPIFAQAFANEPDRGYNTFFGRLKEGRSSLKHLEKHIRNRIKIEQEYAKKMVKWARQGRECLETGSLQAAIELSHGEFDAIANNQSKMVDEMIDRVLAPIQSFAQHYKHIRESRKDALHKSIKHREEQENNVLKLRKNYDSKCHEAEHASIQQKKSLLGSGAERAGKIHPKLERKRTAVGQAEREYRLAEEKLRLLTTAWENDMIQFAEDFQTAETEHITQIKSLYMDLAEICIRASKTDINENERMFNGFSQVNGVTVLNEFVTKCAPRHRDVVEIERSRAQTELLPTSLAVSGKEKSTPFEAKILYNYKAQKPEELSLEEGGLVRIISTKDAPWWEGEFKGSRGAFPSNYVARVA